jgi:hypothetical protein
MKTRIATLMVVLGILCVNAISASEPSQAPRAIAKSVAKVVQSELSFPDFARELNFECCVLVRVKILKNGRFEVDCANCKNDQLKKYVVDKVNDIVSKEHALYAGHTVALKINFRILNT